MKHLSSFLLLATSANAALVSLCLRPGRKMHRSRALQPAPRRFALPAAAWLVASGLCFAPPVSAARYFVTAGVFDGTVSTQDSQLRCWPFDADECFGGAAGGQATLDINESTMRGFAQASGQKLVRASATGSWSALTPNGPPGAGASASLVDEFMLVDTLGNKTEGEVSIHVLVQGTLSENRGLTHYTLSTGLCDLTFPPAYGCLGFYRAGDIFDGVFSGDTPGGFLSSHGTLPFNVPLELSIDVAVGCGYVRDFGECAANLGQSVYWQGMTVLDSNGQPIPGIQVVSASGIDWLTPSPLTPVPIPAVGWLLSIAVAGLFATHRRRSARQITPTRS